MQITRQYNRPIIEITESGCCYMDAPYDKENGSVPDARRTEFFRDELAELARAIAVGANVRLFHAWSLLDNFEWTDGYSQRYGLTYVDFRDQKRTVKDSGLWLGRVASVSPGPNSGNTSDTTGEKLLVHRFAVIIFVPAARCTLARLCATMPLQNIADINARLPHLRRSPFP